MIREKKGFWDRPWSVAQLHPDVQPLVARPLLVLPFSEFGKRARDYARRRASIDNGTVSWISTPYGIGMRFPNPSVGAPTDFLSFSGSTYPTASADIVPHSIAVLWMPTVSANTHFPF